MDTSNSARSAFRPDDLRRAYDRDASQRNELGDLQWRTSVLEAWLEHLPRSPRLLELGPGTFLALSFTGFEVVRREVLPFSAPDGMRPQVLVLRSAPSRQV